jgi:hypothetical protein
MPGRDRKPARIGVAVLLLPFLPLVAAPASAGPAGRLVPAASGGSDVEWALEQARRLASEKLSEPSCRQIFSEFADLEGRPLGDRLSELGHDGSSYLTERVLFYNGNGRPACATREQVAFTSPGSAVVFVCSAQFVEKTHRDPGLAAALLIHEELHSLGLGENPPSSKEITARVIARCGK